MASQLAILLAAPSAHEDDSPDADAVEWCDHKLHEVRECIEELGAALHKHLHADVLVTFAQCSHPRCKRAYKLTQRLRVDGGKENDDR